MFAVSRLASDHLLIVAFFWGLSRSAELITSFHVHAYSINLAKMRSTGVVLAFAAAAAAQTKYNSSLDMTIDPNTVDESTRSTFRSFNQY